MLAHKSTPAVAVETDPARKILRMRFRGVVRGEDMKTPFAGLPELLREMGSGFVQITDLTELDRMELDSVPQLTKMMDVCLAGGVARIIRVIPNPDKDIGFKLLSLTHYRGKVPIATYKTRGEAEKAVAARQ